MVGRQQEYRAGVGDRRWCDCRRGRGRGYLSVGCGQDKDSDAGEPLFLLFAGDIPLVHKTWPYHHHHAATPHNHRSSPANPSHLDRRAIGAYSETRARVSDAGYVVCDHGIADDL